MRNPRFFALAILSLIFISKLSFQWTGLVPESASLLIFQHGMNPYLNIIFNFVFGIPLIVYWMGDRYKRRLHPVYRLFLVALAIVLSVQTLVQIFFVHPDQSLLLQMGGLFLSLYLVLLFGLVLPSSVEAKFLLDWIWRISLGLTLFSLFLYILFSDEVYKGGRFIGVFKHIPYMVTCASLSFVLTLARLTQVTEDKVKGLFYLLASGVSFYAILLTGTRSTALAAMLALLIFIALMPTPTTHRRLIKVSIVLFGLTFLTLLGPSLLEKSYAVLRGQESLMGRAAQDGFSTRWEEIERGIQIFEDHPFSGVGILFRFMESDGFGSYNSFKDPHNIFISAGVVGGWPLIFLSLAGVMMLVFATLRGLLSGVFTRRVVSVYLLVHTPILIIYHVHLSLGGMADRIYWLTFGILALTGSQIKQSNRGTSR